MSRKLMLSALLLASSGAASALAQDDLMSELYGLGVHAYNSGEYREAYDNLSAAVEGGTRDPRAFYFRGLALAQLGRPEDARLDFAKGAQLEVAGGGDRYPIGRALERIQGAQRLTIERVRQLEKIKFQQTQLAESKRRYEDQKRIQAQEPVLPKETPADIRPPADVTSDGVVPAEGDPFKDDGGLGVGAAEPAPARSMNSVEGAPMEEDPFGAAPSGEEPAPASEDPFGGEAPADAPAEEPAPPAGDDPFGAPAEDKPAPAGDDPFGEPAAEDAAPADEAPPAAADPFGPAPGAAEKPAAGADPFGVAPAPEKADGGAVGDVVRGVGAALGEVGAGADDKRDPFEDKDAQEPGADVAPPAGDEAEDPFADDAAGEAPAEAEAPAADDPFAN